MLDEIEAGNLQALFVLGGNLLAALPDVTRVKAALARAPVVVVSDVQLGDMTEHATHVFAAAGPLERADLPHFSDCLAPTLAAQYTPAVVPVGADRRPAWWPLAALAERLGASILPDGMALEATTDDDLLRLRIRPTARATFDELKAAPTALVDDDRSLGWVERNILPDGRWNLAPEPLLAQLADVADVAPLVLIPRRLWRRVNSYGRDLPSVLERDPANILIHPTDAAAAGVVDGGRVSVESAFGRLSGVAKVDDSIRRGAVAIPHGLAEPNVSTLLSADEGVDLLTGMPTYSGVPVTLSAA
jgi:anaerobic selenocysteine-containing dehydrogenase